VIAYSYEHEVEAQQKVKGLAQHYSRLEPRVFALKGSAPWMVTLGGAMSRDEAMMLRDKAVRLGLPEDTFAQYFR
jgi:hypothetical protein